MKNKKISSLHNPQRFIKVLFRRVARSHVEKQAIRFGVIAIFDKYIL